jgi:hypothetical protein
MIKTELADEGCAPGAGEAFTNFNKLLRHSPEKVARRLGQRAVLGEEVNDDPVDQLIDNVLDTTNNGTQIGIEPRYRESMWAQIFEDSHHYETRTRYAALVTEANGVRRDIETLEQSITRTGTNASGDIRRKLEELTQELVRLEGEVNEICRKRGLLALRVVALARLPDERRVQIDREFLEALGSKQSSSLDQVAA